MGDYVTAVNQRNYKLDRAIAEREYNKALAKIGKVNERLYDLGYMHSPLRFDLDEILNAVFEEHGIEFLQPYTSELSGEVDMSPLRCDYVCDFYEGEIYQLLRDGIRAQEVLDFINDCVAIAGAKMNAKDYKVVGTVSAHGGVHLLRGANVISPYALNLFAESQARKPVEINYSKYILDYIFEKVLQCEPSVILDSEEHDRKYWRLILTGGILSTSRAGLLIYEALEEYNRKYGLTKSNLTNVKGFLESISDDMNNYLSEKVQPYTDGIFFGVTESSVFYTQPLTKKKQNPVVINIGRELYDLDTRESLDVINRLSGFSGMFKSTQKMVISGYAMNTLPVRLSSINKKGVLFSTNYYPATEIKDRNGKYVYTKMGYEHKYAIESKVLERLGIDRLENLGNEIASSLTDIIGEHCIEMRELIGALVQTLVCIDCDHVVDGAQSSSDVILRGDYSFLTEELLEGARYRAREIYLNLEIGV